MKTPPPLSSWTAEEFAQLIREEPFWRNPVERMCPHCGHMAVRTYMHYSDPDPARPRVINQTWCANCWRMSASTGGGPPVPFTDPLAGVERGRLKVRFLNEQWDKGVLPQKFG